jgi:hypothetical protein
VAGGVNLGTIFSGDAILTTSSTFLGSYIALLAYTMIGLISGAIVRSSAPALSIPLIWLVVIEPILGGAVKTLSSYLPGALIAKVATPHSLGGFSGNLLLLLLYLLPMVYFACRMTATRDI